MRLAFIASLSLLAPASAEFGSMFVERGEVPTFPGTTTYRIFATFDSPSDRVTALSGLPNLPLEFISTGGELIQDQPTPAPLGCVLDSLLGNGISGPADSFLTIRSVDSLTPFPTIGEDIGPAANSAVIFSPEVLCNATPPVSVGGSSWSTGDSAGGIISFDPSGDEETGQAVLLAQFTLPEADDFTFTGAVNYTEAGSGESLFAFFSINSAELPPKDATDCDTIGEYLAVLNSGTASDCNNNNVLDLCEANDLNDNGLADNCECIADINGDGRVDLEDVVTLLFSWNEPAAGLAVNVDATTFGSENVVNQADLDAVMDAALGTGCNTEATPLSPGLAPVQESRESSAPDNAPGAPVALDVALPLEVLALPVSQPTSERPVPVGPAEAPRTGQVPVEVLLSSEASDNKDALENLLEFLRVEESESHPAEAQVGWDLDRDGLLDPWSVMILPMSSWPEELRPFAELLRP